MTQFENLSGRLRRYAAPRRLALAALVVAAAACNTDKLIAVKEPDVVTIPELQGKASLPSLLGGAISNFQVAFSGSSSLEGQAVYSGLLSDELRITDTFGTRIEIDARDIQDNNSNATAVFRALSVARGFAEQAAKAYVDLASTQTTAADTASFKAGRSEALALAGFSYILFAENYCADGIPFSELQGDKIIEGAPIPRDSILRRALQRLDTALAVAGGQTATGTIALLAKIGRARVYMNMADSYTSPYLDSAVAAIGGSGASGVPTTFQYQITHSENTGRENNGIYTFNWGQLRLTETDTEGTNGIAYKKAFVNGVDVRTAWANAGRSFDGKSIVSGTLKYPERKAPVTLASGAEARLIEAEVALRKGDVAGFIAAHNAIRAANTTYNQCYPLAVTQGTCTNPTAPLKTLTLTAPATAADSLTQQQEPGQGGSTAQGSASQIARENFQFRERALYLYLTSHRLGDMRREVRQFGRPVNTVFPTGKFVRGAANRPSYGNDVSFPVPFDEQNNSLYLGKSCDNTIP